MNRLSLRTAVSAGLAVLALTVAPAWSADKDDDHSPGTIPTFQQQTDWQKAQAAADARIREFEAACKSGDAARMKKAALQVQADPVAVNRMNNTSPPELRAQHSQVTEQIRSTAREGIRQRIAQEYGVRPKDVEIFEATNPSKSDAPRVKQDWDVTVKIGGRDIPAKQASRAVNESFYEAAGGKDTFGKNSSAEAVATQHKVTTTDSMSPDAYGSKPSEGRQILSGPKNQPLRDPQGLSQTIEHKSNEARNEAIRKTADGDSVGAQGDKLEEIRQATKQYDAQVKPRVEGQGGKVPDKVASGMDTLKEVPKGNLSPDDAEAALNRQGTTTEEVIKKSASLPEAAQTLKNPNRQIITPDTPASPPGDPGKIVVDGQPLDAPPPRKLVVPGQEGGSGGKLITSDTPPSGPRNTTLVDPAGNPITSAEPPSAPTTPRRMIRINLKPPAAIEGVGGAGAGETAGTTPPSTEGTPTAPSGSSPGFRSQAFNTAGTGLAIWGAINSIIDGVKQAQTEDKANGGITWFTHVKAGAYAAWNFTGIPHAMKSGTEGGDQSMNEYKQDIQDGKVDPTSNASYAWAKLRSLVYGFGNFTGIKPAVDEYNAMSAAQAQQAANEATANNKAAEVSIKKIDRNMPAIQSTGLFDTPQSGLQSDTANIGTSVGGLAGNEAPGKGASLTAGQPGGSTLGGLIDGRTADADNRNQGAQITMQNNSHLNSASTSGDPALAGARQTANSAGNDALDTTRNTAIAVAQGDKNNSMGTILGNAVQSSLTAGGQALGGTVGNAAGNAAADNLFGTPRKHRKRTGSADGAGSGPGKNDDGDDGDDTTSQGSQDGASTGTAAAPPAGSASTGSPAAGGGTPQSGAAPGGKPAGNPPGGKSVTVTGSGSAAGGSGTSSGTNNASGAGSGGYSAAPQDQVLNGAGLVGNRKVTGVKVTVHYEAYGIPDTFQILYNGAAIANSGSVSGSGTLTGSGQGNAAQVTIRVISSNDKSTQWTWSSSAEFFVK